jgi:hypothetical protein
MVSVGFETQSVPSWKKCGEFSWTIRFYITELAGAAVQPAKRSGNSWIVQHIKNSGKAHPCAGGDDADLDWEYYEAFCIGPEGIAIKDWDYKEGPGLLSQVKDNDTDQLSRGPYPDTWGSWKLEARAYWLAVQPVGLKVNDIAADLMKYVGGLPASKKTPPGLDSASKWTLLREARAIWNCCDKEMDHKAPGYLSGDASAKNSWGSYEETWKLQDDGTVKVEKTVDGKKTP